MHGLPYFISETLASMQSIYKADKLWNTNFKYLQRDNMIYYMIFCVYILFTSSVPIQRNWLNDWRKCNRLACETFKNILTIVYIS